MHAFRQMIPAIASAEQYCRTNNIVAGVHAGVVFACIGTSDIRTFVYKNITLAWIQDLCNKIPV